MNERADKMFLKFGYFDAPDGKELFPKLAYTMSLAGVSGLVISSYDVALYSHPKGLGSILGRYIYFTGPFLGMAAAFTSTTYLATNIRGKDDEKNYFLGGVAAGSIFGAWQKSVARGFVMGMVFGVLAMAKKNSVLTGWEFFPDVNKSTFSTPARRIDFSLVKERPRNWTTDPADA